MGAIKRIFSPEPPKRKALPPPPPPPPPPPAEGDKKAAQAAEEEKRKLRGRKGSKATRLTGGLGAAVSEASISRPTLLGGGRSV